MLCHYCNRQMVKLNRIITHISNISESRRKLWNCITQILHRGPAPSLPIKPNHVSTKSLCDSFSSHFNDKISIIRSAFPDHTLSTVNVDSPRVNSLLVSFEPATVDEVRKIIMSSPNKSCDLDPLPTVLLKACLDTLLKPITDIINASLCSGLFPDDFKHARFNPLL